MSEILSMVKRDSFYFEEYYTGSYPGDLEGLCLYTPTTGSVSRGSGVRMKIEASVDVFTDPVNVYRKDGGPGSIYESIGKIWYIAPKWICPVLDFSASTAVIDDKFSINNKNNFFHFYHAKQSLTNSYHDISTGRGLWGGYGTDPYDMASLHKTYDEEDLTIERIGEIQKG